MVLLQKRRLLPNQRVAAVAEAAAEEEVDATEQVVTELHQTHHCHYPPPSIYSTA